MTAQAERVALVTGCSDGGMGSEFCRHLRRQGWRTFATARRVSAMTELQAAGCDLIALDVTDSQSLASAVEVVQKATNGRLHMLVNNAGRGLPGPSLQAEMGDVRSLFETNVFGLMACTQAFMPMLVRTAAAESNGAEGFRPRVVNVGSMAGLRAMPWNGQYAATKHAVHGYSDALRMEVRGFGVDVLVLAPGVIKTKFAANGAKYVEDASSTNQAIKDELYSNSDAILEARANAFYSGTKSDVDTWAAEQVEVMTRARVPAYHISGGQSTFFALTQYMPAWLADWFIFRRFNCGIVSYKPKAV